MRQPLRKETPPRRGKAAAVLAAAVVIWLVAAGGVVTPIALGEHAARAGDDAVRANRFKDAAADFGIALNRVPYNADYAFRAARATLFGGGDARAMLSRAIEIDPSRPEYRVSRANAELEASSPDKQAIRRDYERGLAIDPNSVSLRLDYAEALSRLGDEAGARRQSEEALRFNDLLSPDEPKRLRPERVREIRESFLKAPTSAPVGR